MVQITKSDGTVETTRDNLIAIPYSVAGGTWEGNAQLIAAAPELLTALKACHVILAAMTVDSQNELHHGAVAMARAAIVKACGETSL